MPTPKGLLDHEQLLDVSTKSMDDMDDRVRELRKQGIDGSDAFANVVAGYGLTPEAAAMFTAWITDRASEHDIEVEVLGGVALAALAVGSEAGLGGRLLRNLVAAHDEHGDVFFACGPENSGPHRGEWLVRTLMGHEEKDTDVPAFVATGHADSLPGALTQMLDSDLEPARRA